MASNYSNQSYYYWDNELMDDDGLSDFNLQSNNLYSKNYIINKENGTEFNTNNRDEDQLLGKYIGNGVTIVSLIAENILNHPFQVLRRQCQVNHVSKKFHIIPFTLLPTIYHLHQHQSLTTLWKGLGSSLLVRGVSLGVEDVISKTTPWPKEVDSRSSLKEFFHHMLLKCLSLAIVTPFYCASFVETVQSDIASEKPNVLDVFREGFIRLLNWNGGYKGRMLPIWILIVPSITLGLTKYLFNLMIKGVSVQILHNKFKEKYEACGTLPKDFSVKSIQDNDLTASLIANISTDIIFYPCETIIYRLYLQGTRTIIDNLDNGQSVLPILTNYVGAIDCYESCLASEGKFGLFKGFGALILQYVVHIALIQVSRLCFNEIGYLIRKPQQKIVTSQNAQLKL